MTQAVLLVCNPFDTELEHVVLGGQGRAEVPLEGGAAGGNEQESEEEN